jgi:zinc transport system substrate-binding protein
MILMTRSAAILLPAALLTLSACGAAAPSDSGKPQVVVSFYALEYVAEQVAGEAADIQTLTQPGVDAHDLDLKPSQIADIASADLMVYLEGFQPAIDEAVAQSAGDHILEVGAAAELIDAAAESDEAEADEDEHADEDDHDQHDPHFWQDPSRMTLVADAVAERLGESFPELADQFRKNATALADEMSTLDEEFRSGLAECTRREFVTTHQAFGYLADAYDLTEIGINGINPDGEASPARIAEVHRLAREHGVTTIFFETLTSPAVAEAIAGDLGLKTAVLDPLEGVTENSPGEDYASIMRANLEALRLANDCR